LRGEWATQEVSPVLPNRTMSAQPVVLHLSALLTHRRSMGTTADDEHAADR
jgi:hypothetical protein